MLKQMTGRKKKFLVVLAVVLVIAAALSAFHIHSVHVAQNKSGDIPNIAKKKSAAKSSPKKDQSLGGDTTPNTNQKSSGPVSSSAELAAPFGSFVSNHHPGQNGTSTTEESICTTTPGASCYIQFTKDGVVKKLSAKTVDSSGSALWDWDIKGSELSPGSWQVSAIATLNGQTKARVDSYGQLEVK